MPKKKYKSYIVPSLAILVSMLVTYDYTIFAFIIPIGLFSIFSKDRKVYRPINIILLIGLISLVTFIIYFVYLISRPWN